MNGPNFDDVTAFHSLRDAARRAARGKRNRAATAGLVFDLETEILQLQRELLDRSYRPRPYRTFTVSDPKHRAISAADPRDRVVHHALCAVLEPVFEAAAVPDSYACRPGKGSHAAVRRARVLARRRWFFLKMDVRKFFETVAHAVLKAQLREVVADRDVLWLADVFIDHGAPGSPPGRGLPIGNLTSQHFANFYLAPLDRLILGFPGVRGYVRYMDDMLVFGDRKGELWDCATAVGQFLTGALALELKREALVLAPTTEGVPFLGFRVFPGCTRLDAGGRKRLIGRVREAARILDADQPIEGTVDSLRSAFAHAAHADTLALRRCLIDDHPRGPGATRARTG